ncbi:hypothetical protein PAJ34TS1_00070 [Paenibacillus azoreducens]|uniref:Uncharacterized protein n=1 Tax=Paenibacillus azoreducens TaxID=116718 RepID=A0A920CTD1_9BACL|nr:hypothetical protein J34TS1_49950 [Paenibacillus azoreducens]
MDLKTVKTADLLNELVSRPGIEKSAAGLYAPYSLRAKYVTPNTEEVQADVLLIIKDLTHLDA